MWNLNIWILVTILTCTNGYNRKCPHSSQWNFTSRYYECLDQKIYICLFDAIKSYASKAVFTASCGPEDLSREGFKYILTPDLHQVPCAASRYQPFTFTTNGNSQCVLSKSLCKASGQILANNGSSFTDASCRCDYTRNYDYMIPPKDPCSCKPAEEDCSCYVRKCEDDKVMIADYRCLKRVKAILPEDIKCPIISRIIPPEETDTVYKIELQPVTGSRTWSKQASVILIVVVIIYTVLIGFLFCSVPHVTSILLKSRLKLSLKRKENEFMILNGDNVKIECYVKSYIPVRSVTWQKEIDGVIIHITPSMEKYEMNCGKRPSLTIDNFNAGDQGKYRCIVRNVVGLRNEMFVSCRNFMSRVGWLKGFVTVLQHIPAFHNIDITLHSYDIDSQSKPTVYNVYKGKDITMEQLSDDQQKLTAVKWFKESDVWTELDISNEQFSGGVPDVPSLTIKVTTIGNAGKYLCLLIYDNGETQKALFKLKIIPQVKIYKALCEHRADETFIRPAICDTIDKHMQENNIVVITGREGTGKSKICLELASFCDKKDFMVLKVDLSENHSVYTDIGNALLIIDDQQYTQDSLNAFMKHLLPVLPKRNIKVILTCRNLDLEIVRRLPEINELKGEAFIDINSCLTAEEKEKMINRYLKVNNIATVESIESNFSDPKILTDLSVQVTLDEDAIKIIKNEEPWKGFPLSVSLFCSERKFLHLGEKYFTNPPTNLLEELKELYKTASINSNSIDAVNEYCILVYIMNNSNHQLDLNDPHLCRKLKEIYQALFNYKYIHEKTGSNEDQKKTIEEALHRMKNKHLKFNEDVYELIHPCLLKAMFLSSDSMVDYLLQNGSLPDITELVRSNDYTGLENELFIKVDENHHQILCERLVRHAFESQSLLLHVAQYINTYWHSSGNEFVYKILSCIEYNLFHSLGIQPGNCQPLANDSVSENSMKVEDQVSFSNIIMLVDVLTYSGRDPWIYGAVTPDLIILSGLVTASIRRYVTNRNQTFKIMLSEFQKRMHSEHFVKLLSCPLDKYGNTFFHYLVLFSQMEACKVLAVIEARKHIVGTENVKKYTPLDIAAYLGKRNVLEDLNLKTSCTKKLRDRLDRLVRGGMAMFYDETSKNKNSDQAMVDFTKDEGVSPEQPKCGNADVEKEEIKNESKKKKNLLKRTLHRIKDIKDKHNKTGKHDSEFIDILCFDDFLINAVEIGEKEDYQFSFKLLSKMSLEKYEMLKEL